MIFLCRNGHKHRTQDGATNCGYCKANERRFEKEIEQNLNILHVKTSYNYICKLCLLMYTATFRDARLIKL
jgi:hypothetical protein